MNGQVLYTAAWRPNTIGEIQIYEWAYKDFRAKYDSLWNNGWRLFLLNNFVVNGEVRYNAVWRRPAPASEIQLYESSYEGFRKQYDSLWCDGWRLRLLNVW